MLTDQDYKYKSVTKRVKALKGFYRHFKIFLLINGILYLFQSGVLNSLIPNGHLIKSYYFDWVHLNALIWGAILVFHAFIVFLFKPKFLKKWEARKIKELMERDTNDTDQKVS
ncbi:2TM domain-containing protein [uncultured Croceitalea sp.]|uniref:2TM domain-containing protein n=1 Tax=uncultured Croceitalea sp. TaxID=1798908 RepID=UPI0033056C79